MLYFFKKFRNKQLNLREINKAKLFQAAAFAKNNIAKEKGTV